jgi:hypothetical protein
MFQSDGMSIDTSSPFSVAPVSSGHAVNDVLVSCHLAGGAQVAAVSGTGWTLMSGSVVGTYRVQFAWKRATATTGEAPTWTSTGTGQVFSNMCCFRGCETTGTPWDSETTFGDATTADSTPDAPAFTTLGTDRLVVALWICGGDNATPVGTAPWSVTDHSSQSGGITSRVCPAYRTVTTAQSVAASQCSSGMGAACRYGGILLPMFSPGGGAVAVRPPTRRRASPRSSALARGRFN